MHLTGLVSPYNQRRSNSLVSTFKYAYVKHIPGLLQFYYQEMISTHVRFIFSDWVIEFSLDRRTAAIKFTTL